MAYSALSGTLSAQGYRLQLPPARGVCPTVLSVALSLRRGIVKSPKTAISRGPCARSMAYSALSGTLSAQGYRLQLPPARGVWPTVPSVALCLRRGIFYSYPLRAEYALQCTQWHFLCAGVSSTATPCARTMPYSALSGTFPAQGYRQIPENRRFTRTLRAEYALQCSQWHFVCAGVSSTATPCARSMPYSALSGTLSAQGYCLQLPPARGACPTVPSVALCLRRGIVKSPKTAISRGPCARSMPYSALSGTSQVPFIRAEGRLREILSWPPCKIAVYVG